jgi:hypothetical protein
VSDVVKSELSAAFRQKGFVLALLVIAAAALGLNTTMKSVGLYFKKERVELRRPLDVLPRMMGPWLQISKDMPLPEEQEHSLGTKDYITRGYIDTRLIKNFDLKKWDAKSDDTRRREIGLLRQEKPESFINLHMAYYTGMADTVAHVPERCYVGGGYDPVNPQVMRLDPLTGVPDRNPNIKIRYTEFVDRAQSQPTRQNVGYFFQVNGAYECDSIGGVRVRLQSIREKYAYYCKVEMLTTVGDNAALAQHTMSDLMRYALPEIEKCLPDWHAVTGERAVLNEGQ